MKRFPVTTRFTPLVHHQPLAAMVVSSNLLCALSGHPCLGIEPWTLLGCTGAYGAIAHGRCARCSHGLAGKTGI